MTLYALAQKNFTNINSDQILLLGEIKKKF